MKKKYILISLVIVIFIAGFVLYDVYLKRTPEKILLSQFGISLNGFRYSIISNNEQWDVNGDGYCLIIFDLSKVKTQEFNILINDNYKKLPISSILEINEIPAIYLKSQDGYYIYEVEKKDSRNFKIFIINTKLKKGILYYQMM